MSYFWGTRDPFEERRLEVSLQRYVQIKPLFNGCASCVRVYWRRGIPDRRNRWEEEREERGRRGRV